MPSPRLLVWILRGAWAILPLVAGPAVAGALDGRSGTVQLVAAVGAWAGWLVGLIATLVPTTVSLTVLRVLAPGAPVAVAVAGVTGAGPVATSVGLSVALLAAILAFLAEVGEAFVGASAYGDETRFPLRCPGPLLLGPLEGAWIVMAAGLGAGPLLLAARQWVVGVIVTVVGVALAIVLGRRFHRLARRWFVSVPAGVVLHDPLVLADNAMFRRRGVAALALAPADTTATDVTGNVLGYAVELRLTSMEPVTLAGTVRERRATPIMTSALLFTPSRPGRLLAEAGRRQYATAPPRT